ncbi:MAG: hypothetical protein AAFO75_11450 [Pseudomonadota bacterium]
MHTSKSHQISSEDNRVVAFPKSRVLSKLPELDHINTEAAADIRRGLNNFKTHPVQAKAAFRSAMEADPTDLMTYLSLMRVYLALGQPYAALNVGHLGLAEAAKQAGLPNDWRIWSESLADFSQPSASCGIKLLRAVAFVQHVRKKSKAARGLLMKYEALAPALASVPSDSAPNIVTLQTHELDPYGVDMERHSQNNRVANSDTELN